MPHRASSQPLQDLRLLAPQSFARGGMSASEASACLAAEREKSLRNYLQRRSAGRRQGRRVMRPYELDVLFHYLLCSADIGALFARMRSFYFMLKERLGDGIFTFETRGDSTYMCINYAWCAQEQAAMKQATLHSLEPIFYFLQWVVDREIDFREIAVPWSRDDDTVPILANVSARVIFDADKIRIGMDSALLAWPLVRKLHELPMFYTLLPCFCAVGFRSSDSSDDYFEKIILRFFETHQRMPQLDDLAAMFGQSVSSLKRTLQAGGLSFRVLLNRCKYACACRLLRDTGMSIKEVAFCLGYGDHNAFRRAFRTWSGLQPGKWRQQPAAAALEIRA